MVVVRTEDAEWLRRAARQIIRSPEDADDLCQQVLLLAWRRGITARRWLLNALRNEHMKLSVRRRQEREALREWAYSYASITAHEPWQLRNGVELRPGDAERFIESGPRDAARGQQVMDVRRRGTHCRNGHERNGDNTRYIPDGTVRCLDCRRVRR